MKVLILGSGIAGLCAAIRLAEGGARVELVSPYISERSQSVMAAGGINASDNVSLHAEDTFRAGCGIESRKAIEELCQSGSGIISRLEDMGVLFTREPDGTLSRNRLGGHSEARTAHAGSSTGKQIVTALCNKCLEYEAAGTVHRYLNCHFYSALIKDGVCYGALLLDDAQKKIVTVTADRVIAATGGQNALFGKTTGSALCDGYAAAKLFTQGARLKNLEFIQYHPTAIETSAKNILITEGVRALGGRLYYTENGRRVYFMEEKYGPDGNLRSRDVVSREIALCPSQVYLDMSGVSRKAIAAKLQEPYFFCRLYLGIDITKEDIPVTPTVHFFMGGLRVDDRHRTDIKNIYAIGECAAKYHGANRLGGNSLLAAIHSAFTAADDILSDETQRAAGACQKEASPVPDFSEEIRESEEKIARILGGQSLFSDRYILSEINDVMKRCAGIFRNKEQLEEGIVSLRYYEDVLNKLIFDSTLSVYENYRLPCMAVLGRAILLSALKRTESRGAHNRSDYPESSPSLRAASIARWENGEIHITFEEDTGEETHES